MAQDKNKGVQLKSHLGVLDFGLSKVLPLHRLLLPTCNNWWWSFALQSLYAKKVEVQDYKLLCLAKVELKEETISLVGILGGWWTLPTTFYQGNFSFIRNGALKHYSENN